MSLPTPPPLGINHFCLANCLPFAHLRTVISLLQIYRFCPEAPLDSNDAAALAAQLITLKADRELTVTPRAAAWVT